MPGVKKYTCKNGIKKYWLGYRYEYMPCLDCRSSKGDAMPGEVKQSHIGEPNETVLKLCPFCGGEGRLVECIDAIMVQCCDCLASSCADDKESAISAWNRRAPEPGTSVVRWVRYDGTPETLPDHYEWILFTKVNKRKFVPEVCKSEFADLNMGDIWAYLPEPPEGM